MRDITNRPYQTFEFAFELEFKDGYLRMFPANQSSLEWLKQHEEQVTRIWNSVKKPLVVRTDSPKDLLAVRDRLLAKFHDSFQDMYFSGSVLMPIREVVESWRRYE